MIKMYFFYYHSEGKALGFEQFPGSLFKGGCVHPGALQSRWVLGAEGQSELL